MLKRASHKDILVYKGSRSQIEARMNNADKNNSDFRIATGSVRRRAQWLHRFPHHQMESLRGNVNTRLKKLAESNWNGAVFAAAGLERISLRPDNSIDLDWMLPAPAQGAIGVYCRENDGQAYRSAQLLHDQPTAMCCNMEREFLRALLGGCSTPISALATISGNSIIFKGNVCSPDGKQLFSIEKETGIAESSGVGKSAAEELLQNEAVKNIIYSIRNGS